jgi:hypothetical protein
VAPAIASAIPVLFFFIALPRYRFDSLVFEAIVGRCGVCAIDLCQV